MERHTLVILAIATTLLVLLVISTQFVTIGLRSGGSLVVTAEPLERLTRQGNGYVNAAYPMGWNSPGASRRFGILQIIV